MISKSKRGQEEIVGFALIVIIVSIILVFFLVFSLSDKTEADSYEAESFLQTGLHYTSTCSESGRYLQIQDLAFSCYTGKKCESEEDSCAALNNTLKDILRESWPVGYNLPAKGYRLEITAEESTILSIEEGNITSSYKGAQQLLSKGRAPIKVLFNLYY
ncbi:MAG: hypothetical protein AABX79_03250 [Nanoarchaeota archaeon]